MWHSMYGDGYGRMLNVECGCMCVQVSALSLYRVCTCMCLLKLSVSSSYRIHFVGIYVIMFVTVLISLLKVSARSWLVYENMVIVFV